MFTKLHVENFLSLKNVDMELGKVNVFIGPNASGKSNIARALQLIAKHARDGLPILEGYKSFRELCFNFNPTTDILLTLEKPIGKNNYVFVLQLTSKHYFEQISMAVDKETFKVLVQSKGDEPRVYIDGLIIPLSPSEQGYSYYGKSVHRSVLKESPFELKEVYLLASDLGKISVHSFAPDMLRLKNSVSEPPS